VNELRSKSRPLKSFVIFDLQLNQDGEFDLVFSNSVIEHVGDFERMRQFVHEARRVAKSYWIQTPSKWFPIEPHCGMPFWWLLASAPA